MSWPCRVRRRRCRGEGSPQSAGASCRAEWGLTTRHAPCHGGEGRQTGSLVETYGSVKTLSEISHRCHISEYN